MAAEHPSPLRKLRFGFWQQVVVTAVVAALFLIIANSAIWVNRAIFDTDTFTTTAVTSLTSDSSRQALAQEVVDRALADRPVIKNVAGNTATKLVSGLLGTDQFNKLLTVSVSKLQVYLTSKEHKTIAIDFSGVKDFLNNLLTVADNAGRDTSQATDKLNSVPDQVTLIDGSNIPNFYTYGLVFLWLGPICGLLAVGLLVYPYFRKRAPYYKVAWVQGLVITVAGFLALLLGPLFRPPVLANVTSGNLRIVIGNLYDAFVAIFNNQTVILISFGVALAVLPALFNTAATFYARRGHAVGSASKGRPAKK